MATLVSTASDRAMRTLKIGAQFKPFEHHGMYAFFARARAEEPVIFCPEINYWVVTTREDILSMLQDATRFSADIALAPVMPLVPEGRRRKRIQLEQGVTGSQGPRRQITYPKRPTLLADMMPRVRVKA